jgi:hypothetical protein
MSTKRDREADERKRKRWHQALAQMAHIGPLRIKLKAVLDVDHVQLVRKDIYEREYVFATIYPEVARALGEALIKAADDCHLSLRDPVVTSADKFYQNERK